MDLSTIGVIFLMAAWFIQLFHVWRGKNEIQKGFLITYAIGSILLVADGFTGRNLTTRAWQNLVILAFIAVIFVKTLKAK